MRRSKGLVSLIPQVLMVGIDVIMSISILFLTVVAGGVVQENIEPRVNYAISEVKVRSVMTSTLNGEVDNSDFVREAKYGNDLSKEVISVYLSQGHMVIGERRISGSDMEADIQKYLNQRMQTYFANSYYKMSIKGDERKIVVQSDQKLEGSAVSYSAPLALTGGKTAEITLWLEKSGDVY